MAPLVKGHSTTTRKGDGSKKIEAFLEKFKTSFVSVGVHDDAGVYEGANPPTVAQVALWNEFGTVNMPERSFIRSTVAKGAKFIQNLCAEKVNACLQGTETPEHAMESIGFNVGAMVQKTIGSNVPPDLTPKYLASKKAKHQPQRTLIASRTLLRSITYRVNMEGRSGSSTKIDTGGGE